MSFGAIERLGFHVVADHFYEPIPNVRELARDHDPERRRNELGLDLRGDAAAQFLCQCLDRWGGAWREALGAGRVSSEERSFRGLDALSLYVLIREFEPSRVVEIGQGASTGIIHAALEDVAAATGQTHRLTSVDPYPRLRWEACSSPVTMDVRRQTLQDAWAQLEQVLADGDLLFIDSTHVYKAGSDAQFLFDVVLPSLPVGVGVHLHDIFAPYDYPLEWATRHRRFWNESHLLETFLRFNEAYEVTLPIHLLSRSDHAGLRGAAASMPALDWNGGSFYIRRVR